MISSVSLLLQAHVATSLVSAPDVGLACVASNTTDVYAVGQGRCVDSTTNVAASFGCVTAPCPTTVTVDECAAVCVADPGCTGFELRSLETANVTTGVGCFVFVSVAPTAPLAGVSNLTWVQYNGTQAAVTGRSVSSANGDTSACCYKNSYPRPNPATNPVPMPPKQSAVQIQAFAERSAMAHVASTAAIPKLVELINYCAVNSSTPLFDATSCPGMAGVSNGTLPTAMQLLDRFADEVRAVEFGHGYSTLSPFMDLSNMFNPSYPFLMNLWEPCTLGLNVSSPCKYNSVWDVIQKEIFGCPAFSSGTPPLNFHDAAERIVFTAMNFARSPAANTPQFGGVDAIFRQKYIADMIMFTPTDTGAARYDKKFPNCTQWPNCTAGTVADHFHILYAWMTGGGPVGAQYTPTPTPTSCVYQMEYLTDMVRPRIVLWAKTIVLKFCVFCTTGLSEGADEDRISEFRRMPSV